MKKKIFALATIIGFICGSVAFAWQDPCNATQNNYTYEECTLTDWIETTSSFSPAPRCSGTVLLLTPGDWIILDYISYKDTILIVGIPCKVTNEGNLVCKFITQPEESYTLSFGKE